MSEYWAMKRMGKVFVTRNIHNKTGIMNFNRLFTRCAKLEQKINELGNKHNSLLSLIHHAIRSATP